MPPAPPRPQGIERNVVITQWDWADPKAYLHDSVSTDRRNPTVNANGLLYGALELSADYLPVLDPVRHTIQSGAAHRSRPEHAADAASDDAAVAVLGQRSDLDQQEQRAQPDARREAAACGSRRRFVRPTTPTYCKEGSSHPSAKLFPIAAVQPPPRDVRPEDQEAHAHQHLLRHAPPDVRRGRQQHALDERRRPGRRLAEYERCSRRPATKRSRRAGPRSSSTPTATASATPTSSRTSRSIRRRTSGTARRSTRSRPAPDGSVWGSVLGFPGAVVRLNPGANPPETTLAEVYEPPFNNDKAPIQGFSPRGGDVDRNGVVLVGAGERPPGQLRSPQVQGAAQRTEGDRPALPRGLDALRRAAAATQRRDRSRQRRGQLLHLGRSVRHARARREHADQHRQRIRRAAGAEGRQVGRAARAVSDSASTRSGWTAASTIRRRAGRGEGCGPPSARARRSTWKRGKGTTSKVIKFQLRPDPLAK